MGTQRNFGITVDDTRWQRSIDRMLEMGRIEIRVGILRGTQKYPAGWVGTKSRQQDTMSRFAALKAGARKKSMLSAYRGKKKKTPGYKRKARKKRVSVAKVAAVVGFTGKAGERPKIPGMWALTNSRMEPFIFSVSITSRPSRRKKWRQWRRAA